MGIRTWHRGMSFRFILSLRRHHQDSMVGGGGMRIRYWHRGMSFRFIFRLRGHQIIGGDARRYKGTPGEAGKCNKMRGEAR